ncbi:MAG: tripartite tricarboxylate transporter substrate binding protein [Burkholderiaceae bacterium]|jgi:tripartite-type tricarboxylate transporter receptor subunit TctC|nr:tripartite tricarboxylate transporter substrate binding protein [Burkholderiales bacterium]MCZ8339259.1 tripartite tricarboxylate transporter substrate binding protein [Burkholderiaceae bacterium]
MSARSSRCRANAATREPRGAGAASTARRRVVVAAAGAALAGVMPGVARGQDAAYPSRPVTMVVPFPPGGVADLVGRPVAAALERQLGQPVVVENKAGAGGGLGMQQVARSKPDGHTLLVALSSISILPEADRVLGRPAMYGFRDLVPVARFTADPVVLAVRADAPWKTLADFVADARKRPGQIPYGSSGNYGTMHVPMEMLAGRAGVKLLHVPYTGAGPAVVGLLGGQVDALATGPSSIVQHLKAGKVRVLGSWGGSRLAALPEVPTLKELGLDVEFTQWAGLFVPAGTPEPVVARLRSASKAILSDAQLQQRFETLGTPLQYLDAPEFARFYDHENEVLSEVVRRIGKVE